MKKISYDNTMELISQGTDSERIVAKCKIYGQFLGIPFEAETTNYYWTNDDNDPSTYWWTDGNMACDCNRYQFLPDNLKQHHDGECGHEIMIIKIVPLEGDLPTLFTYEDSEM